MACLRKRGSVYYAQYYVGQTQRRVSLETSSLQIAKEKLRRLESSLAQGDALALPTRTPVAEIVAAYVRQIRLTKRPKSAQTDIYYLREAFGPICEELRVTSRRVTGTRRTAPKRTPTGTRREHVIAVTYLEQVTTSQVTDFIAAKVRARSLAPKTANRYREILHRLFAWAINDGRVRMPGDRNPITRVGRIPERAPEISYLTLPQIQEQLEALTGDPQLRAMVATLIYAGVRREELLWLTKDDVELSPNAGCIRIRAKTIGGVAWQPKTRRNRAIPTSSDLRRELSAYVPPPSELGWFFPSPQGQLWDPDNFSRSLRAANERANLNWTCLEYRHSFGSHLAMKGESLYKIATLMGNSPEICRRHYAALSQESLVEAVEFARWTPDREP